MYQAPDITRACQALLVKPADLPKLDQPTLKASYRARAFATHPDRAGHEEAFKHVNWAYRLLRDHLAGGGAVKTQETTPPKPPPSYQATGPTDHYWRGSVPQRPLRLGEFLYYTSQITFNTWVAALVHQQSQRPHGRRLGQVLLETQALHPAQLVQALAACRVHQARHCQSDVA